MTNTETVSTERLALQAIRDRLQTAFGAGVWDMPSPNPNGASRWEHQQAALFSIIETCDKALSEASRTQSPAEWQVGAAKAAFWARGPLPYAGLDEYDIRLAEALRAAPIPAPERSKEETGVRVKPLEWVDGERGFPTDANTIIGRYRVWDFDGEDSHYMRPEDRAGLYVGGNLDHAKAAAQADYEQRIKSALVAPVPVPVTITDEMVERLARHYAGNHGVPPDEPLYDGSEQLAWHAWVDDARAALTAALSAKPGEQG